MSKPIACILAVDNQNAIAFYDYQGKGSSIPWNIKEDFDYFKSITTTTSDPSKMNAVIMGSNTWFSIPKQHRPLKGRVNIVISSSLKDDTVQVFPFPSYAIDYLNGLDQIETIFICGGAKLYNEFINSTQNSRIYLTRINKTYELEAVVVDLNLDKYTLDVSTGMVVKDRATGKNVKVSFEEYTRS